MINDSGNRTKFESGAVRDIQEGKGRCDLLPLDIIDLWCDDGLQCTLYYVGEYLKKKGSTDFFQLVLDEFTAEHQADKIFADGVVKCVKTEFVPLEQYRWNLVLEVAKHFEEGAKKYGDRNWEKGIPCDRYIDSAVRHYCKWRAGWDDEPHDRAFIWNIVCCEWTRQRYGWNLEKLEKKNENDTTKSGLQCNWADLPNYTFDTESYSKKFVGIGEQFSRAIGDSMDALSEGLKSFNQAFRVKIEEIKNEDILAQINEQEAKDQETANLKEACAIVEHDIACHNSLMRECWGRSCKECEHYIDPDITHRAINQLLDHAKKSLKGHENAVNDYVVDTADGWKFYNAEGRLISYIYHFDEPEEQKKRQLGEMLKKVWHEVTNNPYTIEMLVEEWGYVRDKNFSICIAPSEIAKAYDNYNRKYNEE